MSKKTEGAPVDEDELRALVAKHQRRQGPKCTVGLLLAKTNEPWFAKAKWLLDNAEIGTYKAVSAAISELTGFRLGFQALQRHKRGDCRC